MNCEAGSLYPHRVLLEEAKITTCFNDYHDLMVAARIGKEGYIRQIAVGNIRGLLGHYKASWHTDGGAPHKSSDEDDTCVCVYHVGQKHVGDSPGTTGECIACMAFECARCQVDVTAGDGNKACYLATPKSGRVPTYECSLFAILYQQDDECYVKTLKIEVSRVSPWGSR